MSATLIKEFVRLTLEYNGVPSMPPRVVNIFDTGYHYVSTDSIDDLIASARRGAGSMWGQGTTGPSDPKYLNVVANQMKKKAIPGDVISTVLLKLRMMKD